MPQKARMQSAIAIREKEASKEVEKEEERHRRWDVGAVALGCNRITSSRPRCIRSNLVAVGSDKLSPRCILAGEGGNGW